MYNRIEYLLRPHLFLVVFLCSFGTFFCTHGNSADKDPQKKPNDAATATEMKGSDTSQKKTTSQVTVYITSWCPACKMTIDYLKKENIPHTVKDVEKNPDFLKEMTQKVGGNRGVPVIDINGKILLGFNPNIIKEMLR